MIRQPSPLPVLAAHRRARTPVSLLTALLLAVPAAAGAQAPTADAAALAPPAAAPLADVPAVAPVPRGPLAAAARAGAERPVAADALGQRVAPPRKGASMGQPVALMIVGGAGLLTGLLIGGDGGTVIAVGGAVAGLIGLYQYIR